MHRKIVEAVKKVCEDYNENKDVFEVYIQPQETGGFWSMVIRVDEDKHYFLPHIENIANAIGRLYGESLFTLIENNYLRLS